VVADDPQIRSALLDLGHDRRPGLVGQAPAVGEDQGRALRGPVRGGVVEDGDPGAVGGLDGEAPAGVGDRADATLPGVPSSPSSPTMTGAWSLAPLPLRSSRSIAAAVTRSARPADPRTKSIRIPRRFGKARRW